MKEIIRNGKRYRLPNVLNAFQTELYLHLINWKWAHLTEEPGTFRGRPYDALLPQALKDELFPLYDPIKGLFQSHQKKFPFKSHKFLGHMASSQAACANLFLPLMQEPALAAEILRAVKPDLRQIATDQLDAGFRIEFWDEPYNLLNDHNAVSGTDADFAIAYDDENGNLNLWLIEHKLTEAEFTTCGGARSKNRTAVHRCQPIGNIIENPELCYYHSASGYRYWDLTLSDNDIFDSQRLKEEGVCPFKGGMNQLWRNQLLAMGIEKSDHWPYKKVFFSVVYHPDNIFLQPTMQAFHDLIGHSDRFFSFTSNAVLKSVDGTQSPALKAWAEWYCELYRINIQ
jgi:hypothetical protein